MIKRNGNYIRPGGSTQIEAKDILMVLADNQDDFNKVNTCLQNPGSNQKIKYEKEVYLTYRLLRIY